jgi:hypothetical protein
MENSLHRLVSSTEIHRVRRALVGGLAAGALSLTACAGSDADKPETTDAPHVVEPSVREKGNISDFIGGDAQDTAQTSVTLMESKDIDPTPEPLGPGGEAALHYQATYETPRQSGTLDVVVNQDDPHGALDMANMSRVAVTFTSTGAVTESDEFEYVEFADPNQGPGSGAEVWGLDITRDPSTGSPNASYGGLNEATDEAALVRDMQALDSMLADLEAADFQPVS